MFRGPSNEKVVALTFDDGPDPRFTPRVLAILKKYNVHATFFVVGENAERYPELLKKELAEGHTLGNHTYTHPTMTSVSPAQAHLELSKCNAVIEHITGISPRLFRPPKGFYNVKIMQMLAEMGYQPVMWSLAIEHHEVPTPPMMVDRVLQKVQPGMIILGHDGRLNRENTVRALPGIISGLKARGYRFMTVDEMLDLAKKTGDLNKNTHPDNHTGYDGFIKFFHLHL
jgi:peptidoglycan/xylan/chitin deacetylase (PgdA/CDA1 family)